jgi:hypothetical protein
MHVSPSVSFPSGNPVASRALSAFEFCFGAFIVIAHNVFHIVPNEVIILSVLGLISIRLRRFRRCGTDSGICLHACRSQPLGQHFGSRIH